MPSHHKNFNYEQITYFQRKPGEYKENTSPTCGGKFIVEKRIIHHELYCILECPGLCGIEEDFRVILTLLILVFRIA